MLFAAAAIVIASIHSSGGLGGSALPNRSTAVVATAVASSDGPVIAGGATNVRSVVLAPGARGVPDRSHGARAIHVDPAAVARLRGPALLRRISALPSAALRRVARASAPQATILDAPPTAADVAAWWASLPNDGRTRTEVDAPQLIGDLEGVPYPVRDRANRATLRLALDAAARDDSTTASSAAMLGQIRIALVQHEGDPTKQLLTIDTRGAGRAAIALGDLGAAADVTVMVPGMFFTVTGQLVDWTDTGADLYREQATLAPAAAAARDSGTGTGVAVLAWMGYRTPDLSNVLSLDLARAGAPRLERVISGIDVTRGDRAARVSVVAHSYGSTTSLLALSSGRVHVDSLTVLGSPGSRVQRSSQLGVTAGQVFVGDAHWDPVAGTGFFGHDPGATGFGSTLLDLAGGIDHRDTGDAFRRPFGHNDYLKPGTASLHAVALIAIGRSDLVLAATDPRRPDGGAPHDGSPEFLVVRPQDLHLRD